MQNTIHKPKPAPVQIHTRIHIRLPNGLRSLNVMLLNGKRAA